MEQQEHSIPEDIITLSGTMHESPFGEPSGESEPAAEIAPPLPPAVQKKIDEINASRNNSIESLLEFHRAWPDIFNYAEELNQREGIYAASATDWWGGALRVNLEHLEGFKGEFLMDLLLELEQKFGVEFCMKDNPTYSSKDFTAEVPWRNSQDSPKDLSIIVEARLASNSTGCHRVVIGEEVHTERRPIYQLVCSE